MVATANSLRIAARDGTVFELSPSAVEHSETLRDMVEETDQSEACVLPDMDSDILAKVVAFLTFLGDTKSGSLKLSDDEHAEWKKSFVEVDKPRLARLLRAGDFLKIQELVTLVCEAIMPMTTGRNSQQIRADFGAVNT
ncbi:SKP1-like protein 3 [Porphyridium purpureum]|uniref:SKP1-like protein 3 n=1 Tax=Porphyridium purpureum TaxID=35688 RepID=A0A5J4YV73_PORPP|nr:SKP1-like protein 3 [Porphyridium purpureum]|eukprot:POR0607..scf209_3